MDSQTPSSPPAVPAQLRLPGRRLRQATLVIPATGERVKRDFTLRDPRLHPSFYLQGYGTSTERTPLLGRKVTGTSTDPPAASRYRVHYDRTRELSRSIWKQTTDFWSSQVGQNVFKASLAYLLGILCVFSTPIATQLGPRRDANQLVATVVVWFDPACSVGNMQLAWMLGLCGFVYGAIVAFSSMGLTVALASRNHLILAHVIVVVVFFGGSLGFIAWAKQHFNQRTWAPLASTASAVASLAIVGVLTKEGAVQSGEFSYNRIVQNLKMLVVGIVISAVINLTIFPISAASELRDGLTKTTTAFGNLLSTITGSFLSGLEEDFNHPIVHETLEQFNVVFHQLPLHLAEARYEHFLLGTEQEWHAERQLVDCLQKIAQDMGGLRSAAATQFALMKDRPVKRQPASGTSTPFGPQISRRGSSSSINTTYRGRDDLTARMLESIEELSENSSNDGDRKQHHTFRQTSVNSTTAYSIRPSPGQAADLFDLFMDQLGPPMKSLAFTLKEILSDLPSVDHCLSERPAYRRSLADAIGLFSDARREALDLIYHSRHINQTKGRSDIAGYEEVAASCGHFSSSLLDFAENSLKYLDILDNLELQYEQHGRRSWRWLAFWRWRLHDKETDEHEPITIPIDRKGNITAVTNSKTAMRQSIMQAMHDTGAKKPKFPYRLWPYLSFYRREEFRFAVKVGGGAALYAAFSYIPATQPFYDHWHLEWGLAAYTIVCSMTVGASHTVGWSRFYGTLIGGLLSLMIWYGTQQNPIGLAFFSWLVAFVSFYFAFAKDEGPLARFILLTYNLSVLYAFSLLVDNADIGLTDPSVDNPTIFQITYHRVVAILLGCTTGIIVTRLIWPIKARKKLKYGLSLLWLRMSLMWKRAPLAQLAEGFKVPSYMDIREETQLRAYVDTLNTLRLDAESEFELRGPFNSTAFDTLLQSTTKMLDAFHALNVIITKDLKSSIGEAAILAYCADERDQLARRISHLLSVLASSLYIEYPLNDALPDIRHTRDRFLSKIYQFRQSRARVAKVSDVIEAAYEAVAPEVPEGSIVEEDYEILYAYALVTAQIAAEIDVCAKEVEKLYGVLSEDVLKLQ